MAKSHTVYAALAASLALALAACGETAEPDERIVDDTNYDTPADIELPDTPVETPEADTDGVPEAGATAPPEPDAEPMMETD